MTIKGLYNYLLITFKTINNGTEKDNYSNT